VRILLVCWCACGCGAILYGDDDADAQDAPESEAPVDDTDARPEGESLPRDDAGPVDGDVEATAEDAPGDVPADESDVVEAEESPDVSEDVTDESTPDVRDTSYPDATTCHGPWVGEGSVGTPGSCMAVYEVGVYVGETYTISTCGTSLMDPLLAVYGACNCVLYEDCGGTRYSANYCSCVAERTGTMTICASAAQSMEFVRWSYTVEGPCYDV
jgi:hypothetical protein